VWPPILPSLEGAPLSAMPWRRKTRPEIVFDEAARNDFLTGFQKRKEARRKQAAVDALEWERHDKIEARKDHREMVKRQWKEVAYAERKVEALMDMQEKEKKRKKALRGTLPQEEIRPLSDGEEDVAPAYFLRDRSKDEKDDMEKDAAASSKKDKGGRPVPKSKKAKAKSPLDNDSEEQDADPQEGGTKKKALKKKKKGKKAAAAEDEEEEEDTKGVKTVDFGAQEESDDDPWGGCEVTTVEAALRGPGLISDNGLNWAVAIDGQEEGRELTPAEDAARRERRWENLEKQEAIRLEALEVKIEKMQLLKKREGKKRKEPKGNKKKRLGKRDRVRRTKQAKRK